MLDLLSRPALLSSSPLDNNLPFNPSDNSANDNSGFCTASEDEGEFSDSVSQIEDTEWKTTSPSPDPRHRAAHRSPAPSSLPPPPAVPCLSEESDPLSSFRRLLSECPELNAYLHDRDCRRFLKARKGDVAKANAMAVRWWQWYNAPLKGAINSCCPRNILLEIQDPKEEIYKKSLPHCNAFAGKRGQPIYCNLVACCPK